jgi:Outer membrane protein
LADKLEQVIKEAVTSNPAILMRSAHKYAQANQVREANSGYLPRIDFVASYGRDHNENYYTRLENPVGGSLTLTKSEAILSIKQMLFDGFAVRSEVEANSARDKSSAYHVLSKLDQVIVEVAAAYIDTIMLRSIYMHAKDNLTYHQQIVDDFDKNKIDHKRSGDVELARSRLATAQTIVLDLQRDIRNSQADYIKVVGKKPGVMYRPDAPEKIYQLVRKQ